MQSGEDHVDSSEISVGSRVRVWWPACDAPNEAAGAAFYPATILGPTTGEAAANGDFFLQFASGEFVVSAECIFPVDNPVAFGGEVVQLKVGELVEVSNSSDSNPCAWLVRVVEATSRGYVVEFPFDGRPRQEFLVPSTRRPRFYEKATDTWSLFQPFQTWDQGAITSPIELEFIFEHEYFEYLAVHEPEYLAALALMGHPQPAQPADTGHPPSQAVSLPATPQVDLRPAAINLLQQRHLMATNPPPQHDPGTTATGDGQLSTVRPTWLVGQKRLRLSDSSAVLGSGQTQLSDQVQQLPLLPLPGNTILNANSVGLSSVEAAAPQALLQFPPSSSLRDQSKQQGPPTPSALQAVSAEPLLMWVRPVMHKEGNSMLVEMTPAQHLPEGAWVHNLKQGTWDSSNQPTHHAPPKSKTRANTKAAKGLPKRALNPYLVYLRKHETAVRAQNPEQTNTQLTHTLAKMWKSASEEERAACKVEAEADKVRYLEELTKWKEEHPDHESLIGKPKVPSKRGVNGYVLFMKDFQNRTLQSKTRNSGDIDLSATDEQKLLEAHGSDLNAAISAAWKALPDAKKSEYKNRANAQKRAAPSPAMAQSMHPGSSTLLPATAAGNGESVVPQSLPQTKAIAAEVRSKMTTG